MTHHHKEVRFEIIINEQQHNDENGVWNNGVCVGKYMPGFESSRVEILTSLANTTATDMNATTNDNSDDDDNGKDKARRATPSIIHTPFARVLQNHVPR